MQDSLGCADKKATKLLRELEEYGLIERKRRGLGKPDLIYVKNFSSISSEMRIQNRDNDDSGAVQNTLQDPAKLRCNKTERNNTEVSDTDPIYCDENAGLAACALMNRQRESGAFMLAVDLPSGINTDTGEAAEGAVRADLTVTFDSCKPLHTAPSSAPFCGEIVCADIGIRDEWHPAGLAQL